MRLKTPSGEYAANFVARKFLDRMFEKNRQTGECAGGAYFSMPGMVVAGRIDEETVRKTIEEMIKNREMEEYFREI